MEENMIGSAEINSNAYLSKKRKFQAELLGVHFQKHQCLGQTPAYDSSSDSNTKEVRSSMFMGGCESDAKSANDSYRFNGDAFKSPNDDEMICVLCSKTPAPVETSLTSTGCGGTLSEIDPYSLESKSLTKSSSIKSESLSICEESDYLHHAHELLPSRIYEEQLLEFESHADCICSDCQKDGLHCTVKEVDDLLYSNGVVAPSNYVLSSGRWSVNQDTQQGTKKLTIDKEFEEYFSMLML